MYTGAQLPLHDLITIRNKAAQRKKGHLPSAKHKARGSVSERFVKISPGEIVYLYQDRDKTRSRDRYIVIKTERNKSYVRKFVGNQLRSKVYEVDNTDIIKVHPHVFPEHQRYVEESSDEDFNTTDTRPMSEEDSDVQEDSLTTEEDEEAAEEEDAVQEDGDAESVEEEERVHPCDLVQDPSEDESEEEELQDERPKQNEDGKRRSKRERKEPDWFKAYYRGKRLSQLVPEK